MSQIDTRSATWAEVSAWAQSELARARELLESETTSAEQMLGIRARIKQAKRLLELPSQSAPVPEREVAFAIDPPRVNHGNQT